MAHVCGYAERTLRYWILFLSLPALAQSPPDAAAPPEPVAPAAPAYNPTNINYGMGAIVPGSAQWKPLSGAQRRKLFLNDTIFNPRSIGGNIMWSAIDLSKGEPDEWRQGVPGYGLRLASRYGRSVTGNAIQHGGAALLGTDVRYVRSSSTNALVRIGHAIGWRFVTMHKSGRIVPDVAGVSAVYLQEMIGVQWVPGRTVTNYAIRSANQQMVQGMLSNVFREFLPDIKRAFRRKPAAALPPPPVPAAPPPAVP